MTDLEAIAISDFDCPAAHEPVLFAAIDNGHFVCQTESTLDEWFRSLKPEEKARVYALDLEAGLSADGDGPRLQTVGRAVGSSAMHAPTGVDRERTAIAGEDHGLAQGTALLGQTNDLPSAKSSHADMLPGPVVEGAR